MSVNLKYIVALALVIVVAGVLLMMNPHRKYSTETYWEKASVALVQDMPQDALKLGNKNGGVLMWAAMGTPDPAIIRALVARGADVNESDPQFKGTPLTAAAGYGRSPQVITELVRLGADVNKTVNDNETPLMIAARFNHKPGYIEALAAAGADIDAKNVNGRTALDIAVRNNNDTAAAALRALQTQAAAK